MPSSRLLALQAGHLSTYRIGSVQEKGKVTSNVCITHPRRRMLSQSPACVPRLRGGFPYQSQPGNEPEIVKADAHCLEEFGLKRIVTGPIASKIAIGNSLRSCCPRAIIYGPHEVIRYWSLGLGGNWDEQRSLRRAKEVEGVLHDFNFTAQSKVMTRQETERQVSTTAHSAFRKPFGVPSNSPICQMTELGVYVPVSTASIPRGI